MSERLNIRSWLPVLPVSYLHGRGEFFTTSLARIDSGGFMQADVLKSSEPVFGVRFCVEEPLEVGKRYSFVFSFTPETVEYILVGQRAVYERVTLDALLIMGTMDPSQSVAVANGSGHLSTCEIRIVADTPDPIITFVRDRAHARHIETLQGTWQRSFQGKEEGRHCSEWSEVDDELAMPLNINLKVRKICNGPECFHTSRQYTLISGLRYWTGPRVYHRMPADAADVEPPKLSTPDYPTDSVMVVENDDIYGEVRDPANGSKALEQLASHLDLCDRYGVTAFALGSFWSCSLDKPIQEEFVRLVKSGRGRSISHVLFTYGGPSVEQELNEGYTRQCCDAVRDILGQLPQIRAIVRIMEINTNGQWARPKCTPSYLAADKTAAADLYTLESQVFIEEHSRHFKKIRDLIGYHDRVEICIQDDGPTANPHWVRTGMDYFVTKNIWGFNTNLVQAFGRGFARSFGKPIGLAYDSHRSLDYEQTNPTEVEHVYRSYFLAGMEKTMYEAPFVGCDVAGVKRLTESGAAFYRIMNWARSHPQRGRELVKIGFIKGSDDYGLRNPAPGQSRHGHRHRLLVHKHPAYEDWNLLDIVFPGFGDYEGSNPYRFLTGTPYGQADVLPFDASIEHLLTFDTLVMIGRNRLTREAFENYLQYARSGGTLVLALEHLLHENPLSQRYAELPLDELIGARLGGDRNIVSTDWREWVPSRTNFYNEVQPTSAETVEATSEGAPLLLRNRVGDGEVYFYTSDYLSSLDPKSPRRLLHQLFAGSRIVRFEPETDWVQYFVRVRDGLAMLSFINHGQAGFPQGMGPKSGPWRGEILIDLSKLGIADGALDVLSLDDSMSTDDLPAKMQDGFVRLYCEIDIFKELVVGPVQATERLLFYGRNVLDGESVAIPCGA